MGSVQTVARDGSAITARTLNERFERRGRGCVPYELLVVGLSTGLLDLHQQLAADNGRHREIGAMTRRSRPTFSNTVTLFVTGGTESEFLTRS